MRDCWRVIGVPWGGVRRAESMGTMDESGRFMSSRSSLVVNAASRGPRLPMIDTCWTLERDRTSRTCVGTSYFSRV